MAKHEFRTADKARTELLGLDNVFSIKGKGNEDYYFARSALPPLSACPYCNHSPLRTHNTYTRKYRDVITTETGKRFIDLSYEYFTYRCLKEEGGCGRISSNAPELAPPRSRVTGRLADYIAQRVLRADKTDTYICIANDLNNCPTHTGIHDIFERWLSDKEQSLPLWQTPKVLAILSGQLGKDKPYTLILSLDHGIRILDIIYGIGRSEIRGALRRFERSAITYAIIDCNPVIAETVAEELPDADIILPVQFWFSLLYEDFRSYAQQRLKWFSNDRKLDVIMLPPERLNPVEYDTLQRIFGARPNLERPYNSFNALRKIIFDPEVRWIYDELEEWFSSLPDDFGSALSLVKLQLTTYRSYIVNHQDHRDLIPPDLWHRMRKLQELLELQRTNSDQLLKARVLYLNLCYNADNTGIPIDRVIQTLTELKEIKRYE